MGVIFNVVLPVFLLIGAGYGVHRLKVLDDAQYDPLMRFAQVIAVPCLLFRATYQMDLGTAFDLRLVLSFYIGCTTTFFLGIIGARVIFKCHPGEAVALGFGALFSNSVMLGIPVIERAFGPDAMQATIAIISIHAAFCYALGTVVMEASRPDGRSRVDTAKATLSALIRRPMLIGAALGFVANFSGLVLPEAVIAALNMIVQAAIPTALFALGGILTRYRIGGSLAQVAMISVLSLIVHPGITFALSHWVFDLPAHFVQAAVTTAAMAPGVNAYIFATMYQRGEATIAATILLAKIFSLFSVSVWVLILTGL